MGATTAVRGGRSASVRAGGPLPTNRRRPGFMALGVGLVFGLGVFGAWLYASAGAKTPVVVVVSEVPAGHPIKRSDVSKVSVAGGITAIAARNLDSVVGQNAAVTLLPGMLLQRSMVTSGSSLGPQQAEVGVAVTSGQIPADGLSPGDTVQVLRLPDDDSSRAGDSEDAVRELVAGAQVFAVRADPAQAGGTLLTLTVPPQDASSVASASGAGRIALVRVAGAS
jgi:Flp pilus assembly protein CpaB